MKTVTQKITFASAVFVLATASVYAAGIQADAVNELTPNAGVTVDGVALKDGKATGTSTTANDTDDTLTTKDYVAIPRVGTAHVVVQVTNNAATNGTNLLAAYTAAKALEPNGAALSATNRAVVLVPPGIYDLGASTLSMDTNYVDLVGLSTARENQRIYGGTTHVLTQTAADVRIENLLLHYTGASNTVHAYYPNASGVASPYPTTIRNCAFRVNSTSYESMRPSVEYAGTYEHCVAGGYGTFGGDGTASGTFTNCSGDDFSFGGDGGTANGTFANCTGGYSSFGGGGVASGTFTNCTGTNHSFGGGAGTASGTFVNCSGAANAFGGFGGTASGTFTGCSGGDYAFGGMSGGTAPGGKFYHCVGGANSFTTTGSPTVLYCVRNGAAYP